MSADDSLPDDVETLHGSGILIDFDRGAPMPFPASATCT
jgi:hypothetical protein